MTTNIRLRYCLVLGCGVSVALAFGACSNSSHDPGINGQPTQDTNSAARAARGNQKVGVVPGSGPAGSQ